jgi:flagellar protein FliO/FliZ
MMLAAGALPGGYGWYLLQTLLALAAVCALAWVVLRWGVRRLYGGASSGRVRVLERVPLDPRRSLYLVEVGGKVLLLGAGDGPMTTLAEVDPNALPAEPEAKRASFLEVLKRRGG